MRAPLSDSDGEAVRGSDRGAVEGAPLRLIVTLGDMPADDAFYMDLQPAESETSVGALLDELFPDDAGARATVKRRLDVRGNPDLPEMYDALADVLLGWRAGRQELAIFSGRGRAIELRDGIGEQPALPTVPDATDQASPVLRIVLQQTLDPIGYAVRKGYYETEEELLAWVQDAVLLYLADFAGQGASSDPKAELSSGLTGVVRRLQSSGMVASGEGGSTPSLTEWGRHRLRGLIEEVESYVRRFDIFSDVLVDPDGDAPEFGTGGGDDLRVAAYEWEGLNPVRVVTLLRIFDGAVVQSAGQWRESIVDRTWLAELLAPVVDCRHVDEGDLEQILNAGYTVLEEVENAARTEESQKGVLRRLRQP